MQSADNLSPTSLTLPDSPPLEGGLAASWAGNSGVLVTQSVIGREGEGGHVPLTPQTSHPTGRTQPEEGRRSGP